MIILVFRFKEEILGGVGEEICEKVSELVGGQVYIFGVLCFRRGRYGQINREICRICISFSCFWFLSFKFYSFIFQKKVDRNFFFKFKFLRGQYYQFSFEGFNIYFKRLLWEQKIFQMFIQCGTFGQDLGLRRCFFLFVIFLGIEMLFEIAS